MLLFRGSSGTRRVVRIKRMLGGNVIGKWKSSVAFSNSSICCTQVCAGTSSRETTRGIWLRSCFSSRLHDRKEAQRLSFRDLAARKRNSHGARREVSAKTRASDGSVGFTSVLRFADHRGWSITYRIFHNFVYCVFLVVELWRKLHDLDTTIENEPPTKGRRDSKFAETDMTVGELLDQFVKQL